MPPALLAVSGVVLAVLRRGRDNGVGRLLGAVPGGELALGIGLAFVGVWLAVTLLYSAAARARLPFRSAAIGGALASVGVLVVLWVFATFQVGASQSSALSSGLLALPVFLLWVFSSWYVFLVGAEIAVAHHVDQVLVHGASTFRLDGAGERQAGVSIMVRLTEVAAGGAGAAETEDELARRMRLPPHIVRELCFRLVDRGLLSAGREGFALHCDPTRTTSSRVAEAIDRDPALDDRKWRAPTDDLSLQELAERRQNEPPPAALNVSP